MKAKYSTRNNSVSYESRRPAPDLNNRQAAMPSDNRRSSLYRPNTSVMPNKTQQVRSTVNNQPETRRTYSQPLASNSNRSIGTPTQSSSPSRRESTTSTNRALSQQNSRPSEAGSSRTNDNGRRK